MNEAEQQIAGKSLSEISDWAFWIAIGFVVSIVGYLLRRWWDDRKPLSANARHLLKRIKTDPTHEAKGITLHFSEDGMNYWTYRVLDSDATELGMFYEIDGEYLQVRIAVEELVQAKKLQLDPQSHSGLQIYSLT